MTMTTDKIELKGEIVVLDSADKLVKVKLPRGVTRVEAQVVGPVKVKLDTMREIAMMIAHVGAVNSGRMIANSFMTTVRTNRSEGLLETASADATRTIAVRVGQVSAAAVADRARAVFIDEMNALQSKGRRSITPVVVPTNVRFMSNMNNRRVYVTEVPPGLRTITTNGRDRRLYLPWVVLAINVNGDIPVQVHAFIRRDRLRSIDDELLLFPLNNTDVTGSVCMGDALHKFTEPDHDVLVREVVARFFGSEWNQDIAHADALWKERGMSVREWEKRSLTEKGRASLFVDWPTSEMTIGVLLGTSDRAAQHDVDQLGAKVYTEVLREVNAELKKARVDGNRMVVNELEKKAVNEYYNLLGGKLASILEKAMMDSAEETTDTAVKLVAENMRSRRR
jgi:hypothetical protein